ncbi:MAG: SPFH domain-containing protein [Clostridiales bacterium]|jgi:membrane protease subunit (stomatin/prohibitin family)|nr:SPFH domain-containing protein [Clostridiales bacterium]
MGLFSAIKKQLPKVIEWSDESSDTIVYRYPLNDRKEIMQGSQLTVRESQVAVFVAQGKIADVFLPGKHKLETANLPILTTLFSWKYAFESPYTGEIYFVNTKQFINQKWGTSNPIMMRDKDFGMARIRAYGVFAFRVKDAAKLMRELSGTGSSYKTEDIIEHFRKMIFSSLVDSIAESNIAVLDLAANYREFGAVAKERAVGDFDSYGIEITAVYIESISLPDEVNKALDSRTSVGMFGANEMGKYMQYQTAQAIPEAAKNPGGGMAAVGAGMGVGLSMMKTISKALNETNEPASAKPETGGGAAASYSSAVKCYKCGAALPADSKFCTSCGATVNTTVKCPKCGASNSAAAKFCGGCGAKLSPDSAVCKKCGAALDGNAKFCPECGAAN